MLLLLSGFCKSCFLFSGFLGEALIFHFLNGQFVHFFHMDNRVSFLSLPCLQVVNEGLALIILLCVHQSSVSLRPHMEEWTWGLRNEWRSSLRWNRSCLPPFGAVERHLIICESLFHLGLRSVVLLKLLLVKICTWKRPDQPTGCARSLIWIKASQLLIWFELSQVSLVSLLSIKSLLHGQLLHDFADGHQFPYVQNEMIKINFLTYLAFCFSNGWIWSLQPPHDQLELWNHQRF